jgi:hypothetical protein
LPNSLSDARAVYLSRAGRSTQFANMDFIRIAGASAEGVLMASGPVMNPEGQPDSALTKKPGLALDTAYEAKYGHQQPQPVRRPFLRRLRGA